MFFIEKADKPNKLLSIFNILKLEEEKIILPFDINSSNDSKIDKIVTKIEKIMKQYNSYKVVLSEEMFNNNNFKNRIYTSDLNIELVDGKWLFSLIATNALEFIFEKLKLDNERTEVAILVNDLTDIAIENIDIILRKYKNVKIVTRHIEKFKNIEKRFRDEDGILINLTNNKKKALQEVKIILNLDFPNELINKYRICDDAIILSMIENIKIKDKRYSGLILDQYKIKYNRICKDLYDGLFNEFELIDGSKYENNHIYEAYINKKQNIKKVLKKIKEDNVKIVELSSKRTILK